MLLEGCRLSWARSLNQQRYQSFLKASKQECKAKCSVEVGLKVDTDNSSRQALNGQRQIVWAQIQADLGEGHVNVVQAKEALLTDSHLALVMEYAACGSLTNYVTDRWQNAQCSGFFLEEDEARYFFRVSQVTPCPWEIMKGSTRGLSSIQNLKQNLVQANIAYMLSQANVHFDVTEGNWFCLQQFINAVEYCHDHFVAHR